MVARCQSPDPGKEIYWDGHGHWDYGDGDDCGGDDFGDVYNQQDTAVPPTDGWHHYDDDTAFSMRIVYI